jgi:hypothetical protein
MTVYKLAKKWIKNPPLNIILLPFTNKYINIKIYFIIYVYIMYKVYEVLSIHFIHRIHSFVKGCDIIWTSENKSVIFRQFTKITSFPKTKNLYTNWFL